MSTSETRRFRLLVPPALGSIEFDAADATDLMERVLEARQRLVYHSYVLIQIQHPVTGAWRDPLYQNESRELPIKAHAYPYAKGWEDVWGWLGRAIGAE